MSKINSKVSKEKEKTGKVPPQVSLERRLKAWELRTQQRMTLREITLELNKLFPKYALKSDHQAVAKMLEETEKEYQQGHAEKIETVKNELLALKDYVIRESRNAWERSKDPEKAVEKRGEQVTRQTAKDQDGDHRYLQTILAAVEDIERAFGLDKAPSAPLLNLQIDFAKLSTDKIVALTKAIKEGKNTDEILSIVSAPDAG